MKRLTEKQKAHLVQRSRRSIQKHSKLKCRANRTRLETKSNFRKVTTYRNGVSGRATVESAPKLVPKRLNLQQNYEETVQFLRQVREGLTSKRPQKKRYGDGQKGRRNQIPNLPSYWDFTTLQFITVPVALMLASEYDRSRNVAIWNPVAIDIERWDPHVLAVLRSIGFLKLAGVEQTAVTMFESEAMRLLPMQRGDRVDAERIGRYLSELGIDVATVDPRLSEAISEAVTNAVNHAYNDSALLDHATVPNWWLVAGLSKENGLDRLRIAVYDHGATIPRTLPSWDRFSTFGKIFKTFKESIGWIEDRNDPTDSRFDGDAIRIAMDIGRSSTAESHRGKGLAEIVEALDLCERGEVAIYSRNGEVRVSKGMAPQSINHPVAMVGTLIFWDLSIKALSS